METKELVIKAIKNAGKPMKASEIAVSTGIDKTQVEKAIKQLQKEEILFSPIRCYVDIKK